MSKSKRANPDSNAQLRIVGGKHRGRKLPIPTVSGLRPTPDRVRETVFNWLQFDIHDKAVLDCFAGTGALGLEALSRGALSAQFVEPSAQAAKSIEASLSLLKESNAYVHKTQADAYLSQMDSSIDLIFIDPPFQLNLWESTLTLIEQRSLLAENGLVYIECPKAQVIELSDYWLTVKDKVTGNLRVRLLQRSNTAT